MSSPDLDDAAPVLDSPTELFPDGPDPSNIVDREHQRQEELGEAILTALTDPPLSNTRRATTSPPTRQASIVILSPRLSPSPSPDPTSERLASLVALLHDRRTSNASPPPAPSSPPPNSPPAPGNLSNAAANLTRAEALQRYLDRRLVEGLSALPPRELVDWRIAERRNNNELEMEIQNLLAAAGSTLGRVGDEGEDEGDSPELLFITSLRRGTEARRRRLQGSSAPSMNADGRLLDWDTPLPVRRSILEESRGVGDSQLMELVDTPQSPGRTTGLSGGWDPVMSPEERRARVQMMELAELRGQEERLEEMQRELDALEREEDAEAGTSASRVWRYDPIDIDLPWLSDPASLSHPDTPPPPPSVPRQTLFESREEVEWRRRSAAPPPSYPRRLPTFIEHLEALRANSDDWGPPHLFAGSTRARGEWRPREETNALLGQTMRGKKDVLLLYCGAGEEELPSGFKWEGASEEGCGALVCARGLGEGPWRVFGRGEAEEKAVSSDLPPRVERVRDVEGESGEGDRGVLGCTGCVTKDIGCRACGNVLGFRVIRPCGPCSVSRASPMDGFVWHYRAAAITTRPRLYDVFPTPFLSLSSPDSSDSELDPSPRPRASSRPIAALPASRAKEPPAPGLKLKWANVPHPQADFEDRLVAEPAEWIRGESDDTWWLENAVMRHCAVRRPLRREMSDPRRIQGDGLATNSGDRRQLSSRLPPVPSTNLGREPSTSDALAASSSIFSPPPRHSLARSYAIRVPHAPATRARAELGASPERRVRARLEDGRGEEVLNGVGYGSGFVEREGAVERRGRGGRELVGR